MNGILKKILTCLLIIFSVILFTFLFGFITYKAGSFPVFNQKADAILGISSSSADSEELYVVIGEFEDEIQPSSFFVSDKTPVLYEIDSSEAQELQGTVLDFPLAVNWNYPVVSNPFSFSDAIVFVDARPCVVLLDVNTNDVIKEIPCAVYPSQNSFIKDSSYYFESRSGSWFELRFTDDFIQDIDIIEPVMYSTDNYVNINQLSENYVLPSEETLNIVNEKMSSLFSSEVNTVTDIQLYLEEDGIVTFYRKGLSPLFVFSPEEQGAYVIGLCDYDGVWVRDNAFVTLFSKTGETRAVSLDYVADRPQITIHLSNEELYYICVGFMDSTEEITDVNFQIKKAP